MSTEDIRKGRPWFSVLRPYLRPFTGYITLALVFMTIDALLTALRPWPLKVIVDKVISGEFVRVPLLTEWINGPGLSTEQILNMSCLAMLGIAVGTGIFSYLFTRLIGNISQRFVFNLREATFGHLQRLSLEFHTGSRLGDNISRLTSDINALQTLTAKGAMIFLSNFFLIITRLIMMIWLNWRFTLIACSVIPILFVIVWWYTTKIQSASRVAKNSDGEMASIAQETLGAIRIVKGMAQEDIQDKRYAEQGKKSLKEYLNRVTLQATMAPIIDLLAASGLTLVMFFGAKGVMAGTVSIGDIIVFFFYVSNFYSPIRAMSLQYAKFSNGIAGAERVAEILARETVVKQDKHLKDAPSFTGKVAFRNVSFAYQKEQPILKNISFEIQPGEYTAIIGSTGAGKSTLAGLLLRFFDPVSGDVLIDRQEIKQYTRESIRKQIGLILQDSLLLAGSIRDNIAFGCNTNPTDQEIVEAAKNDPLVGEEASKLDKMFEKMAQQYNNEVEQKTQTIGNLIEPVLIVGLGLLVGFILACILCTLASGDCFQIERLPPANSLLSGPTTKLLYSEKSRSVPTCKSA